jgi:hypothetical protein
MMGTVSRISWRWTAGRRDAGKLELKTRQSTDLSGGSATARGERDPLQLALVTDAWGRAHTSVTQLQRDRVRARGQRPVRLAYQPPASSTFLSQQTSYQQSASSTLLSEQISTSHQPPAKRTGRSSAEQPDGLMEAESDCGGGEPITTLEHL